MGVESSDPKNTMGIRVMPDKQGIDRLNRYDPVNKEVALGDTLEGIASVMIPFVLPDPGNGNTVKVGMGIPYAIRIHEVSCYGNKTPATSMVVDVKDDNTSILDATLTLDDDNEVVVGTVTASKKDIADASKVEISAVQTGAIAAGGCNTTV